MDPLERLVGLMRTLIASHINDSPPHDWGVVESYNPAAHTATVRLAKGGLSGHLPIETAPGLTFMLPRGASVRVAMEGGQAVSVAGLVHNATHPPPAADLALENDAYIGGVLTLGRPLLLGQVAVLPPPTAALRGALAVLVDGTTTADQLVWCAQSATGTYSWITVTHG